MYRGPGKATASRETRLRAGKRDRRKTRPPGNATEGASWDEPPTILVAARWL